jgi:hypothetical protein
LTGPTGPTGPGVTGPTGPSCVTYQGQFLFIETVDSIAPGGFVNFNVTSINNGFTLGPSQTVNVLNSGNYRVNFRVQGTKIDTNPYLGWSAGLWNGVVYTPFLGYSYEQTLVRIGGNNYSGTISGEYFVFLNAGDQIRLQNPNSVQFFLGPLNYPDISQTRIGASLSITSV